MNVGAAQPVLVAPPEARSNQSFPVFRALGEPRKNAVSRYSLTFVPARARAHSSSPAMSS
jgi:hypothetical protein